MGFKLLSYTWGCIKKGNPTSVCLRAFKGPFQTLRFCVPNALETMDNEDFSWLSIVLMRSAHEKRDLWNKP
jgi:hypothetical protein